MRQSHCQDQSDTSAPTHCICTESASHDSFLDQGRCQGGSDRLPLLPTPGYWTLLPHSRSAQVQWPSRSCGARQVIQVGHLPLGRLPLSISLQTVVLRSETRFCAYRLCFSPMKFALCKTYAWRPTQRMNSWS